MHLNDDRVGLGNGYEEDVYRKEKTMSFSSPPLEEWFRKTLPDRVVRLRKKGNLLFSEGDPSDLFYVISEGRILIMKESPSGNPVILERLLKGDFVGGFAVIADFPYPASAIADCPSVLNGYSKEKIRRFLREEPEIHRTILSELGSRFQNIQSMLLFSKDPTEVRLARVLFCLWEKGEGSAPRSDSSLGIAMTRITLSQMARTTVESTIRITKQWERMGKLDLSKRGVIRILDPSFLRNLSGALPS